MEWFKCEKMVTGLIKDGQEERIVLLAKKEYSINGIAAFVCHVLDNPDSSTELINATLQVFFDTKNKYNFSEWVHKLTHYTKKLWSRGLTEWIKKFHKIAIEGNEPYNHRADYSDRLVRSFYDYANFDDNPADFYLDHRLKSWSKLPKIHRERIEAGKFQSENALLQWKLLHKINAALTEVGSQTQYLKSPNSFPEYKPLRGNFTMIIDDDEGMADIFLPHLIVATEEWVRFTHHTTQKQSELVHEICGVYRPNILLIDWSLAMNINGGSIIRELKKATFTGTIIGFSSEKQVEFIETGADGAVYKNTAQPEDSLRKLGLLIDTLERKKLT